MILLAIDCSASLCAASVFDTETRSERGRAVIDIGKGHAERLMGVVADALQEAVMGFPDLGAVAVAIGPGSFTGIRVAVSAARGFALALGIPAIGVTTLEAVAAETRMRIGERKVLVAMMSGDDHVQAAGYDELGVVWHDPAVITIAEAAECARVNDAALAGAAARRVMAERPGWIATIGVEGTTADIGVIARIAAGRSDGGESPRPLYLRQPDAKPQAGFILPRQVEADAGSMAETDPGKARGA